MSDKRACLGFTRLELMVLLCAAALLFAVVAPGLANSRNRSQRLVCMDNLRQIGQGAERWAFDHRDDLPWQISQTAGGTRPPVGIFPTTTFVHFGIMSNELGSPKILVCPNDTRTGVKVAQDWSQLPFGGYFNNAYRDNATSYTINIHCWFSVAQAVMSSDRHLEVTEAYSTSCSYGFKDVSALNLHGPGSSKIAWTNSQHGYVGNLLLRDGRVAEVPNSKLQSTWQAENLVEDNGSAHVLIPR